MLMEYLMNEESDIDTEESSGIVTFQQRGKGSRNNNATMMKSQREFIPDSSNEDGEIMPSEEESDDEEEMDSPRKKPNSESSLHLDRQDRENILDEAVNRFHEIFMSSGFMETTADMIQKKILKEQPKAKETSWELDEDRGRSRSRQRQANSN